MSIAGASGVVVDAVISGRLDAVVSDEIEAEYLALPTKLVREPELRAHFGLVGAIAEP